MSDHPAWAPKDKLHLEKIQLIFLENFLDDVVMVQAIHLAPEKIWT